MLKAPSLVVALVGVVLVTMGCATVPQESQDRTLLKEQASQTVQRVADRNPAVKPYMASAVAYAVFPHIGKGGLIFAGGYGRGILYERGKMVGYCDATALSVGAQIGGQSYSELIFFETPAAVADFKSGDFTWSADVQAVAADQTASSRAQYHNGAAVFIVDEAGLMAEAAAGGQRFRFQPGQ